MVQKYEIADWFSEKALRLAANQIYTLTLLGDRYTYARDIYGCCPMGVALMVDFGMGKKKSYEWGDKQEYREPIPGKIALILFSRTAGRITDPEWNALEDKVRLFTVDWDLGKVTNLYAAFGLTRKGY